MVVEFLNVMNGAFAYQKMNAAELEAAERAKEQRHKLIGFNLELYAKYVYKYGVDWAKAHRNYTEEQIMQEEKGFFRFIDDLI